MTTYERFEREIPTLIDELAPPRLPDYLDDMLRQTARTSQRPAWSALERWIPMGVIARTRSVPAIPIRSILVLAALIAVAIMAAALAAGSSRPLPAPFGPARNGQILFEAASGGISVYDPASGAVRALDLGQGSAAAPLFMNDGTKFVFDHRSTASDARPALFLASADGSGAHEVAGSAAPITCLDWSPNGDRMFVIHEGDPEGDISVIETATGAASTLHLGLPVATFATRPRTSQLIVSSGPSVYRVNDDGTDLRPIIAADGLLGEQFSVSPDGSAIVYPTWTDDAKGRLHVVDIDTGVEQAHDFGYTPTLIDLAPTFSPDGRSLLVERYDQPGYRPTIMPLDGTVPTFLGVPHPAMSNGAHKAFSPDGMQVLVVYQDDGTTWLYDAATGKGRKLDLPIVRGSMPTWQRLAP